MGKSANALVIVHSYHHGNTEKIAQAIAEALSAKLAHPQEVEPEAVQTYDIVGFGAGIDSGKHYKPLRDLASTLPHVHGQKAFIFSTSGVYGPKKLLRDHAALRAILLAKGYSIVGEFGCKGHDTVSFLKWFGGINKDRPNTDDLDNVRRFAQGLLRHSSDQGEAL